LQHEWGRKKYIKILVGKPQGMKPLARHIHRWFDNFALVLHFHTGSGLVEFCV
jgi:hypothetical protein